ncbi:MAG: efflux RND transporter periplasmic adaptor subunit [bacterium]|nr:efflux RND transporter periplasmic adaptor subunit [bacterium]
MKLSSKLFIVFILLLLAVLFSFAIYWKKNRPIVIAAFTVKRGDLITFVSASGSIEADTKVKLSSKIGGRVLAVKVKEGDLVKSGQLLVQLDSAELTAQLHQAKAALQGAEANLAIVKRGARAEEIAAAEAQLNAAQASLDEAKKNYQRMQLLYQDGAISAHQFDTAQAQYEVALAQVKSAQEQLRLLKSRTTNEDIAAAESRVKEIKATLEQLQAQLNNTQIYAPFSGTVTQKLVDEGETIIPGAPLLFLADMNTIQVTCNVDETDIGKVRVGMPAKVYMDSYPNRVFDGIVTRIATQTTDLKEKGITFAVKLKLLRIDVPLRIGMSTDVDIQVDNQNDVIYIPVESVLREGDKSYVYVIERSLARKRYIEIGSGNEEYIAIKSGLKENELVARTELDKLRDGARVRVSS